MGDSCQSSIVRFFDALALRWDEQHDQKTLSTEFAAGLTKFGVEAHEHILDVGCGTGNLTAAIIRCLSPSGRVTAIDLSSVMIRVAQAKVIDSRITWVCGAIERLAIERETLDRIICYSVWPHLTDNKLVGLLFQQWLKPGGKLHIWHSISRSAVNKIHAEVSAAVNDHLLSPAAQTISLLESQGYAIEETQDDEAGYLITARRV